MSASSVTVGYALVPVRMTADMINAWSGGKIVSSDEVAYRTTFQTAWKRVLDAAPPANPAPSVLTDELLDKLFFWMCAHHKDGHLRGFKEYARALLQANGATK